MCGIYLKISPGSGSGADIRDDHDHVQDELLGSRGPDETARIRTTCMHCEQGTLELDFRGNVLWLRGKTPQTQPLR